jgi:membrane protease YdiL (CAAX protease family)
VNLRSVPWWLVGRLVASLGATTAAIYLQREVLGGDPSLSPWYFRGGAGATGALELAYLLRHPEVRRWIRMLSLDQWRAIDRETAREPGEGGATSVHVLVVMVVCAISLTLQEYVGGSDRCARIFPPSGGGRYWELMSFAWWSGWRVLGYVVLPMIAIALTPGQRLRDYHVSPRGFFNHFWIYAVLFATILPVVFFASRTPAFRHTYPFYRMANRSPFDLWTWEALYAVQFVSLEFFFRGFLLQGLRRAFGANAIFVMIVPYCMIHYGKPMAETFGAIGAGLILGTLAMRTRSIWGGVLIHIGVATTMDVLALSGCPAMGSGRPCHD